MDRRAFQIDLGRQLEKPKFVETWIPPHAEWGYGTLMLYLEDAFRFPSHPEFAQRHAYDPKAMDRIVKVAARNKMDVMPVVPALGHTAYLLKNPKYNHLGEKRETKDNVGLPVLSGQICPSLEESYEVLGDLFKDIAPFCSSGYLHVSLDESLELGICSLCGKRAEDTGRGRIYLEHLVRLREIVAGLGLRMAVWGDMFYYFPEIVPKIPKDVAVFDWYYYPFRRYPRVELFNFREVDSAGALRKAALETWASPNNGPFFCETYPPFLDRLENIRSWWNYGRRSGCKGIAMTSWSPTYSPSEANFLVNAAAADLWLDPGVSSTTEMMKHGLRRVYGEKGSKLLWLVEKLNRDQICGYWRYQIVRDRLAKTATLDHEDGIAKLANDYARSERRLKNMRPPVLFSNMFDIRRYHLLKERLSATGSALILDARKAFKAGDLAKAKRRIARVNDLTDDARKQLRTALAATRSLWSTARFASDENRLETCIREDYADLKRLKVYLGACKRDPKKIMSSSPLLAERHLFVTVRTQKPCLQGIKVEVSSDGKDFKLVHTLYTLEFSADAGRPDTDFARKHSIPLDSSRQSGKLCVRISSAGIGEFLVGAPLLIDGAVEKTASKLEDKKGRVINAKELMKGGWALIGTKAPTKGLPAAADFNLENAVTLSM